MDDKFDEKNMITMKFVKKRRDLEKKWKEIATC